MNATKVFVLSAAALGLLSLADARACDPGKGKDARGVKVCVVAILASEKNTKVDPKLEAIDREVRKTRPALKGFTMAKL